MHNKKLKGLMGALAICTVIVGGTFAWLGANDSVTNSFKIQASEKGDIDIVEEFNKEEAEKIKTGVNVDKKVQVQNKSDYDSLIRVNIEKLFKGENGNTLNNLDIEKIILNYLDGAIISESDIKLDDQGDVTNLNDVKGKWVLAENKYYYIGNVAPEGYTTQLLDSVTLDPSIASNPNYKGVAFDVIVNAESVQSTVEAITSNGDTGTTNENGFGLDEVKHKNLVAALKAVVGQPSEDGKLTIKPTVSNQ